MNENYNENFNGEQPENDASANTFESGMQENNNQVENPIDKLENKHIRQLIKRRKYV